MSVRDLKPEYFTIEMDGAVCVLRLNRPPANAHNFAMIRELEGIVTEIRYDNDVRAVMLGSANPNSSPPEPTSTRSARSLPSTSAC